MNKMIGGILWHFHLLNWPDSCHCYLANLHLTMLCDVLNCKLSNYEWQTKYVFLCEHFNKKGYLAEMGNFKFPHNFITLLSLFFPLLNELLRLLFCAFQTRHIVEKESLNDIEKQWLYAKQFNYTVNWQ